MTKRKSDPSKTGLSSPNVEGQGTTNQETLNKQVSSARKKQDRV
ncbi:YuzL family protein [Metabacillus herbersteinensis]|uniref:YuzL family protein n=1 Tax=Metabacillus herbersteinensis TaxID=283816 RepID=A0ABV6GDG1_9BACI